jgi:selenium donor protein
VRHLETDHPDELLVGTDTGDDAAVWKLDDDRAIVSTADFITPVVDDARTWGRVAAANSVSDIYAMGGRPLFALNLVGWPKDALPMELLSELLAGGQDIATAGGFVIVGGHTIDDPEPKYGMSVTGEVHPDRILTNAGLRPGQDIILTKALGVGVLTTAIKSGAATEAQAAGAVASMIRLNDVACRLAVGAGAWLYRCHRLRPARPPGPNVARIACLHDDRVRRRAIPQRCYRTRQGRNYAGRVAPQSRVGCRVPRCRKTRRDTSTADR